MTPREKFTAALNHEPIIGRVPHFELLFYPTMQAFNKIHPMYHSVGPWGQLDTQEKQMHFDYIANVYVDIAEKYEHSAIMACTRAFPVDEYIEVLKVIREISGDKYFTLLHGDATFAIPNGDKMEEFAYRMVDEPEKLHEEAKRKVDYILDYFQKIIAYDRNLIDGAMMCSDYCFNTGPFLSPNQFAEFITPYLKEVISGYRSMGVYTLKHTDGNIMPILDQIMECKPHALHSLDPQGNVDIAEVKRLYGKDVCLIGNVNCGLLQTGTLEEMEESVLYSLKHGMPGGGYIFSTSNCVYPGLALERYEHMLEIWKEHGNYTENDWK